MRALLVVDMQVGCFTGNPPRHDANGTVARINALAAAIRPRGAVVYIQHTAEVDGYARGSDAWALLPSLDRKASDPVVEKTACDAFLETNLADVLAERGVDELVIVGCATDFCVDTTVRSAAARDYRVIAPSDGHTTRDRPHLSATEIIAHHNYMWADLILPRQAHIEVPTTDSLLASLR